MIVDIVLSLLRFEVFGVPLTGEKPKFLTGEARYNLIKLSKRHDLAHLVCDALDKNGLLSHDSEIQKRFLQERNLAIYRYGQMQYEYEQICNTLNAAKIAFIPLKGAVLRAYYPEPWMRTSCDIDVLVKEKDLYQAIDALVARGYRKETVGGHDAHLYAPDGVHLELHYRLAERGAKTNKVLDRVWEYTLPEEGSRRRMTDEMFFFYHIAHMAAHFREGGCGVRSFLDVSILLRHVQYDREKLCELLKKGGLSAFAEAVVETANAWFSDGEVSEKVKEIQHYILNAGMYGDIKHRVAVTKSEKGKSRYLLSRIFLPYDTLKFQYPVLQKHKWLTPFYQVRRWGRLLLPKNRKRAIYELKVGADTTQEEQERIVKLFQELQL